VLVEGGTSAQLRQALANALELLSSEALRIEDVIKATVFLVDMSEFADVNEVWIKFFGNHRPARTAIGVGALPLGASVEIELWAVDPSERST
jgi:2-iminobutanoate/2-iminopropanoate deaminase